MSHLLLCLHLREICPKCRHAKHSPFSLANCFLSERVFALKLAPASKSWLLWQSIQFSFLLTGFLLGCSLIIARVLPSLLYCAGLTLFKMGFVGWSHFIDWSEVMGSVAIRACFPMNPIKSLKEGNSPLSSLHYDTKPAHLVMTQSGNVRSIFRFSRSSFRTRRLLMLFIAGLHCLKKSAYLCRAVPSLGLIRCQFSSLSLKAGAITNCFPYRSSSKPLASSKAYWGGSKK